MRKVAVFGNTGAGKSTLSKQLAIFGIAGGAKTNRDAAKRYFFGGIARSLVGILDAHTKMQAD